MLFLADDKIHLILCNALRSIMVIIIVHTKKIFFLQHIQVFLCGIMHLFLDRCLFIYAKDGLLDLSDCSRALCKFVSKSSHLKREKFALLFIIIFFF